MNLSTAASNAAWPAPLDEHNRRLLENAHPPDWKNPKPRNPYNLVVIGAGAAGLVTAAGAAGLGARVALVERHLMGGDCLNVGCVPSKTMLASAHAASMIARARDLGVRCEAAQVDFVAVMERVRRLRAGISPQDSVRRFTDLGVDVFLGSASFAGPDRVEVAGESLRFSRAVIATGARPIVPEIPGLIEAAPLTNETVFNLTVLPRRLAVIGGGPVGCELAQAFQRLGSRVVLIHNKARLLDRDDADAAKALRAALERDGVDVRLDAICSRVEGLGDAKRLVIAQTGGRSAVDVDQILVAAGRAPNVEGLGLESAGVAHTTSGGVQVDDFLRTTCPRVYACGDVCLSQRFTHAADFAARIVIQNALFSVGRIGKRRLSAWNLSWCAYTDPEVAQVGLRASEADARGIPTETFITPFDKVDRALTDGDTDGFVKIVARKGSGAILGGTIVGRHAGELISEVSAAMAGNLTLSRLAGVIHPYPTRADAIRKCGDLFNKGRLTDRARSVFTTWLRWRRGR